jgi:hypothetical protein
MDPETQKITDRLPNSRGVYHEPTSHELNLGSEGNDIRIICAAG